MDPTGKASRARRCQIILGGAFLWGAATFAGPAACGQTADPSDPLPNAQSRDDRAETSRHEDAAITGALTYNSDVNAVVAGGASRGGAYLQRIGLIGDVDLEGLVGWKGGSAHISVHFINGAGLSGRRVGNLLTVSGLEAEPAARLFNLWVEQKFGWGVTLRVGQFTAGQEFAVSPTAALFVNSTFGWPASFAADLPSGGPAYPLAAPGIRFAATPREGLAVRFAVFAGDPAGPGSADPQRRDVHGFNGFRFGSRPFFIGEISRSAAGDNPAWSAILGGWAHRGDFADLALDTRNLSIASPASSGALLKHRGNLSAYAMADARVWRSGPRSVRGFLRVAVSPADRNPLDLYLDAGLSLMSPLGGSDNSIMGVGFAIGRISPRLRAQAQERALLSNSSAQLPRFESIVEASWQLKFGSRAYLQPNFQFVLHPAAAALAEVPVRNAPSKAIVTGVRLSFRR